MDSSEAKSRGLTAFSIKIIAIIAMFIDHVGVVVIQPYINAKVDLIDYDLSQILTKTYSVTRAVGRVAFPLFCFMLVEGFFHTRNKWKYLARLVIFALISEVPFNLAMKMTAFTFEKQSVLVTLSISFLMLIILDSVRNKEFSDTLKNILTILIVVLFAGAGKHLRCDYDFKGILMVAGLYLLYPMFIYNRFTYCVSAALMFFWEWSKTVSHFPASLSPLLLCFYNGKKGRSMKYFFYLFYPVHLLALYFLSRYLITYY